MIRGNFKNVLKLFVAGFMSAAYFIPAPVLAGTPGSASATFLKFTPSPRATAMGESYTSVTEDAYAAYWNPAGLASMELPELAATYNASFEDVTHQYISLAYPLKFGSTLGLNLTRLSVAPFQGYDALGWETRKVEASDMAVGAAYARTLLKDEIERPVLNIGTNIKAVSEKLDGLSANTFALDLGVMYYIRPANYWMKNIPAQEFRAAFAVKNLGGGLKFDTDTFPLPISATLGLAWLLHPAGKNSLMVSLDQTIANDDKYSMSVGAEYVAFQLLAFRAGYKTGQSIGSGVRFGVGFKLSFIDLDYSMSPFGDLGTMHKFGMTMRFGTPRSLQPLAGATPRVGKAKLMAPKEKIEKLESFAKDFLVLAAKNLQERRYTLAQENVSKAFNLEPGLKDGEWGDKFNRLSVVNKGLRLKDTPEREITMQKSNEQADVAHESFIAYVEGHDLKAFLLAHAALGANQRGDAVFEEMVYVLAELTHNAVRRDEILPKDVLIKEKLKKAAQGFYVQRFDMAAKECEEVVTLDEKNRMGWTRLGSAYYMMGDKEKARKAYSQALELDPADMVTRQFMESQGWK